MQNSAPSDWTEIGYIKLNIKTSAVNQIVTFDSCICIQNHKYISI